MPPPQPGTNEIIVSGLTPFLDHNSVKVEGHGTGNSLVTNVTVDTVHPDEREIDNDSEPESDIEEETLWDDELKAANEKCKALEKAKSADQHRVINTEMMKLRLDQSLSAVLAATVKDGQAGVAGLGAVLDEYSAESARLYEWGQGFKDKEEAKAKELLEAVKRRDKLEREFRKTERAHRFLRRRAERVPQDDQNVVKLKLRITIERGSLSADTPSVAAEIVTGKPAAPDDHDAPKDSTASYLRISYIVTSGTGWAPHYDLRLDTIAKTAHLTFGAKFGNNTHETWRDAEIILSSSQNRFSGLDDKPPVLPPWHINLLKKEEGSKIGQGLISREESANHSPGPSNSLKDYQMRLMLPEQANKKRLMMSSGTGGAPMPPWAQNAQQEAQKQPQQMQAQHQMQQRAQQRQQMDQVQMQQQQMQQQWILPPQVEIDAYKQPATRLRSSSKPVSIKTPLQA